MTNNAKVAVAAPMFDLECRLNKGDAIKYAEDATIVQVVNSNGNRFLRFQDVMIKNKIAIIIPATGAFHPLIFSMSALLLELANMYGDIRTRFDEMTSYEKGIAAMTTHLIFGGLTSAMWLIEPDYKLTLELVLAWTFGIFSIPLLAFNYSHVSLCLAVLRTMLPNQLVFDTLQCQCLSICAALALCSLNQSRPRPSKILLVMISILLQAGLQHYSVMLVKYAEPFFLSIGYTVVCLFAYVSICPPCFEHASITMLASIPIRFLLK